jgi:hypothetical protein
MTEVAMLGSLAVACGIGMIGLWRYELVDQAVNQNDYILLY